MPVKLDQENIISILDGPVHDPTLFKGPDGYYVLSTGVVQTQEEPGGIHVHRSRNRLAGPWEELGDTPVPEWTKVYGHRHLWAPAVAKNGDDYYLYYSASAFGKNTSAIGVARTKTPSEVKSWEDLGPVLVSKEEDDFNAIDPMVFEADDKWWMVYGSHWSGIKLIELKNNMKETVGPVYSVASRPEVPENRIEAPSIFKYGKYYYLLTSWDQCCSGVNSTYKVAVGRSENITGPYMDHQGISLMDGGGKVILQTKEHQIGPGGQDAFVENGEVFLVHHFYDQELNGTFRTLIRKMKWEDDWPFFTEE